MKTIAIDFDGVIHKYSKGWHDGSCYDEPIEGAIDGINALFETGYKVFIFSTRSPWAIKNWMKKHSNPLLYMSESDFMVHYHPKQNLDFELIKAEYFNRDNLQKKVEVIPCWSKFWNKQNILGITKKKLPANTYVDDRAVVFDGNWQKTLHSIQLFKTYQETKLLQL